MHQHWSIRWHGYREGDVAKGKVGKKRSTKSTGVQVEKPESSSSESYTPLEKSGDASSGKEKGKEKAVEEDEEMDED